MTLFHITMATLFTSCMALLVGFSCRDYRWGPGLMLLGIATVMGLIVYNIRVLSHGA